MQKHHVFDILADKVIFEFYVSATAVGADIWRWHNFLIVDFIGYGSGFSNMAKRGASFLWLR
ncbi:MAG: hypothetical protein PVI42_19895 [Desulfobacterales bacterium]